MPTYNWGTTLWQRCGRQIYLFFSRCLFWASSHAVKVDPIQASRKIMISATICGEFQLLICFMLISPDMKHPIGISHDHMISYVSIPESPLSLCVIWTGERDYSLLEGASKWLGWTTWWSTAIFSALLAQFFRLFYRRWSYMAYWVWNLPVARWKELNLLWWLGAKELLRGPKRHDSCDMLG